MCAVITKAVPADGSVFHWLSLTLVFCSTHAIGTYPSHINPICPFRVFCYLVFGAHMLSCLQSPFTLQMFFGGCISCIDRTHKVVTDSKPQSSVVTEGKDGQGKYWTEFGKKMFYLIQ